MLLLCMEHILAAHVHRRHDDVYEDGDDDADADDDDAEELLFFLPWEDLRWRCRDSGD